MADAPPAAAGISA
ncbi:unnamed protein product, partial [Diplocarpon coronariae]